jgi:myo-inositol 2-dehydrogenase / D-chiro-inositol 1-dehydrogenase
MTHYRAAIVGCGLFGRAHAQSLAQLDGIAPVAFCDLYEPKARELAEQFDAAYATADAGKVFADESIDVVYVATQHDSHADLCVRALEAGKHVLVEKPLALTVEDCLRIAEAVERTGKRLMVGFKLRYYAMVRKARELIPDPIVVTMQMMDNPWPADGWTNDPVKGGGNVLSQGCHSTDLLRFVSRRDPLEVYACGGNYYQPSGVADNIVAVYRFGDGVAASLVQGDASRPPVTSKFFLQLFAKDRSVTLTDRLTTLTYVRSGHSPEVFRGAESGVLEESRDFVRCLQEDRPPPIDHTDGLYATVMALQAVASARSGRPEPIHDLITQWRRR